MTAAQDVYFDYVLIALIALVVVANLVRFAAGTAAPVERADRVGGTWLVGKPFMTFTYRAIEPLIRGLAAAGVTPNAVTWVSLGLGIGAGVALATGWFGLACFLATMSVIGDVLDGQLARVTNSGSDRGELLDAAVNRYTEYAFATGLVVYFHDSVPLLLLTLGALLACVMVSYASAKAEALQVSPPRGLMRRHERAAWLIAGAGLIPLIGDRIVATWPGLPRTTPELVALAMVGVIGNLAAVTRLVRIGRALPR